MRLCLIRHASTSWNEDGRIQGHTDIPLSAKGRAQVAAWRLPEGFAAAACITSPLGRARETAPLLGFAEPASDPRLKEMRWGSLRGPDAWRISAPSSAPGMRDARGAWASTSARPAARARAMVAAAAGRLPCATSPGEGRTIVLVVAHKGVLRAAARPSARLGHAGQAARPLRSRARAPALSWTQAGRPTFEASLPRCADGHGAACSGSRACSAPAICAGPLPSPRPSRDGRSA